MGKSILSNYTEKDIQVLKMDRDRVQKDPHIYIPDKHIAGAVHLFREAKDNADDEAMLESSTFDTIIVTFDENTREGSVIDEGRGIPQEKLRDLCETLSSSGKQGKAYKFAAGMHGYGQKIINFLSDYMIVQSCRDGKSYTVYYEDGLFIKEEWKDINKNIHGTTITFKPSSKYLKDLDKLRCKHIMKMIEEKADACPGIKTIFKGKTLDGEKIKETFTGLEIPDLLKKYNNISSKTWEFNIKEDDIEISLGFAYDAKKTEGSNLMGWTNYIKNKEGGMHINGLVEGLSDFFKKYMNKNVLTDKEKKDKDFQIKKEDITLGLCGAVIVKMKHPEVKGQYKEELTSPEVKTIVIDMLKEQLKKLSNNDLMEISNIIRNNIKARLSSQRARAQVKKVGNKLSSDTIEKWIPCPIIYDGLIKELNIVEGDSPGDAVASARFIFQEIYKLRGKVDNIFDMSLTELSKIKIVDDLSRLIGLAPGKRGHINYTRINGLTDADADGKAIQAGINVIMYKAFPQVIEEGKLFMIYPPLYRFIDENGDIKFVSTNRDYFTYLQDRFTKENNLYLGKQKLKDEQQLDFLNRNERYVEYLEKLANNNAVTPYLMEIIMSNIRELGIGRKSLDSWNELIRTKFSPQLGVSWNGKYLNIEGIKNGRYEIVTLDEELTDSKRAQRVLNLIDINMGKVFGYSIDGKKTAQDLSISQVLDIFSKYKGKNLKRFKGLGSMDPEELRDTCMDLENRHSVQITFKDVDSSFKRLAMMHSEKKQYKEERARFMSNYIPDIMDIDT